MQGEFLVEAKAIPPEFQDRWLILWDGECGFCRRWVQRVLRRDRAGQLRAVPFQHCTDWLPGQVLALSPRQAHLRSPDGRYWGGGDAAIRLAGLLGHPWLEAWLSRPPFRQLVRRGYAIIARHRGRLARWGL